MFRQPAEDQGPQAWPGENWRTATARAAALRAEPQHEWRHCDTPGPLRTSSARRRRMQSLAAACRCWSIAWRG